MIMGLSKSEIAKATATIIATIGNVLGFNFGNAVIQAGTADKLGNQNNGEDSISDVKTLIIKVIVHYLNLFTFRG